MKPQEEEEEEEEAKPSGPAKPKYIASGGWPGVCLKLGPVCMAFMLGSYRSGPAKQVPDRFKGMGCQAELGVWFWVLAWGEPASPAQPQAALPQVDELVCQCDGAGFRLAKKKLQLNP